MLVYGGGLIAGGMTRATASSTLSVPLLVRYPTLLSGHLFPGTEGSEAEIMDPWEASKVGQCNEVMVWRNLAQPLLVGAGCFYEAIEAWTIKSPRSTFYKAYFNAKKSKTVDNRTRSCLRSESQRCCDALSSLQNPNVNRPIRQQRQVAHPTSRRSIPPKDPPAHAPAAAQPASSAAPAR